MKNKLELLLNESSTTAHSQTARPHLVGLTRATTQLVYTGLVSTQPTTQPVAVVYGVEYQHPDKTNSALTGATFAGRVKDRSLLPVFPTVTSFNKGDLFVHKAFVFEVLESSPFTGSVSNTRLALAEATAAGKIRIVSEASDDSTEGTPPSEATLKIGSWKANVLTRKIKTHLSVELAQDLEANGFDAAETIDDMLATQMAEEINKDIIQSLINVSHRYRVKGRTENGVLDLTKSINASDQGRELYQYVCEMNASIQNNTSFSGDWVLASARVVSILESSGFLSNHPSDEVPVNSEGRLKNGMLVYVDATAPFDYMIVGVKKHLGEMECASSLVYSPYSEGLDLDDEEHIGQFKLAVDSDSLQPVICLMVRYALSVNPFAKVKNADTNVHDSHPSKLTERSYMSSLLAINLPEIIEMS